MEITNFQQTMNHGYMNHEGQCALHLATVAGICKVVFVYGCDSGPK